MKQKKTNLPFVDESIEYILKNLSGKATVSLEEKISKNVDLVIGYHQTTQVFIAWNNCTHRMAKDVIRGKTHTYTFPNKTRFIHKKCDCFT